MNSDQTTFTIQPFGTYILFPTTIAASPGTGPVGNFIGIASPGLYYVSYDINLVGPAVASARLVTGGNSSEPNWQVIGSTARTSWHWEGLIQVVPGTTDVLGLQMYGASQPVTLAEGNGASLTLFKLQD